MRRPLYCSNSCGTAIFGGIRNDAKHRKGKGRAPAKPMTVPSLDNRPRYHTPEVQNVPHLPTPEATPATKTGTQQVSEEVREEGNELRGIIELVNII